MQQSRFHLSPIALSLMLAFQLAHAADGGGELLPEVRVQAGRELEGYSAPTAKSATKTEAALRDIPQTVNVVPEAVIRDQGAMSMQDVLRNVPGVGLSSGDGQRDQVSIRGFSAMADQFIDGLRDDALYFRDLSNIERVEVLKGPAAVLYGRGSSGGLINRISKKPGINLTEIGATVGSWDQRRGEMDVARKLGDLSWRVTGAVERANSYRDPQFLKRESFAPSAQYDFGDSSLLVQGEYTADRRVTDFGIPSYHGKPADVAPSAYYGAANAEDVDYSQSRVKAIGATFSHRFNSALSLKNAFRYYDYSLDRNNTVVGSVNEVKQTVSLNRSNLRRQEDGYFNQTELTQKANLAGMAHQLLYGVEVGQQNKDQVTISQSNIATVDLFNPVLPVLPLRLTAAPSTDNLGILTVKSAYVQDLVSLTSQWKALAGVRYDVFEQETHERRAGQPDLSRTDKAWSPRAGLVFQPDLRQSYYASYSKSFQPSGESFAVTTSNADIAPEETVGYEIGGKYELFGGLLNAGASLFRLERDHIKATDPTTSKIIPVGTQRTDGIELTLAGNLPGGVQAYAGYAWLNAKVISSVAVDDGQAIQGKRATLSPDHSFNLWLSKDLAGGFGLGGGLNYVGDRFANPGNTVTLPGYTTVDAAAWYRTRPYELQLNLYNLFDRDYIVSGHGSNKNLSVPGAPRHVALTVKLRF